MAFMLAVVLFILVIVFQPVDSVAGFILFVCKLFPFVFGQLPITSINLKEWKNERNKVDQIELDHGGYRIGRCSVWWTGRGQ